MSEKTPHRAGPALAVTVLVAAVVATAFGFTAGFVAGDARSGGVALKQFSPGLYESLGYGDRLERDADREQARIEEMKDALRSEEEKRIAIVKTAIPAVVSIVAEKEVPVYEEVRVDPFGGNDLFEQFFGMPGFGVPQLRENGTELRETGAGTGFFVSPEGHVVTNKHVVADTEASYTVITSDGERYPAEVLGRDPSNDLAILKVESETSFTHLELSEDEPRVGQSVIAVGYALGQFSNSVSTGIVSGLSRQIRATDAAGVTVEDLYDVLQTDAAINPGNSGGPLLDLDGRAIGVNVAVVRGSENIGFALPATDVRRVVESVREHGRISRPFLGVRYVHVTEQLAERNQLSYDHGALVVRGDRQTDLAVVPGSPADEAGIVENDIILEIEGEKVSEDNPLAFIIRNYDVGDTVTVLVFHKGEEVEREIELAERR